jgi:GNAT superfamily N-acetyltransferase
LDGRLLNRILNLKQGSPYSIRRFTSTDMDRVYDLRCEWAQETDPAPKQLDRWGPGVAVFVPPQPVESTPAQYEFTPTEPSQAMHQTLAALVDNRDAGCLVAYVDQEPAGFVTFAAIEHPAMPGVVGTIDMLFVRRPHRRRGIGAALVSGSLDELRRRHVHVFRVEYDRSDPRAARFWKALGWSEATVGYLHE